MESIRVLRQDDRQGWLPGDIHRQDREVRGPGS